MVTGKIIRIQGESQADVDELALLLQNAVDTVSPACLYKLLSAVRKNPTVIKTALKFL
jgi:hypothetical protein